MSTFTLKSVPCVDLRDKLPRSETVKPKKRSLSNIRIIAVHHSGEQKGVADDYGVKPNEKLEDAKMRLFIAEAKFHIGRDWDTGVAGVQGGSGFMYHFKIDRDGIVYYCRDLDEVLWHARNANDIALAIQLDGNMNIQLVTHKQAISLRNLLRELCMQHPEFPADQDDVYGHSELVGEAIRIKYKYPVDFGNYTSCPGVNLLSYVREFHATGNLKRADEKLEAAATSPYTPYDGFKDVSGDLSLGKVLDALKAAGVVTGYADGTYRPEQPITRGEAAMLVSKAILQKALLEPLLDELASKGVI